MLVLTSCCYAARHVAQKVVWSKTLYMLLSPGQTDREVVESGRKFNLRRDLRWVAKRTRKFYASTRKSHKKKHFKADYPLFHWLIIG